MLRNNCNNLNAFTIIELLVVLAVSSIVFSLAWISLDYLQNYTSLIMNKSTHYSNVKRAELMIRKDFLDAIKFESNKAKLEIFSTNDTIFYSIEQELLRRASKMDCTWQLPISNVDFDSTDGTLTTHLKSGIYELEFTSKLTNYHGVKIVLE